MDLVVTVPKTFWAEWIDEGDLPGEKWSGYYSAFTVPRFPKKVKIGDRVYVVAYGKLRGYAPLVNIVADTKGCHLIRTDQAIACTIDREIKGFQGFRYRFWEYSEERPFPDWQIP